MNVKYLEYSYYEASIFTYLNQTSRYWLDHSLLTPMLWGTFILTRSLSQGGRVQILNMANLNYAFAQWNQQWNLLQLGWVNFWSLYFSLFFFFSFWNSIIAGCFYTRNHPWYTSTHELCIPLNHLGSGVSRILYVQCSTIVICNSPLFGLLFNCFCNGNVSFPIVQDDCRCFVIRDVSSIDQLAESKASNLRIMSANSTIGAILNSLSNQRQPAMHTRSYPPRRWLPTEFPKWIVGTSFFPTLTVYVSCINSVHDALAWAFLVAITASMMTLQSSHHAWVQVG